MITLFMIWPLTLQNSMIMTHLTHWNWIIWNQDEWQQKYGKKTYNYVNNVNVNNITMPKSLQMLIKLDCYAYVILDNG